MACYTLVQATVKDLASAQAALRRLNLKADIQKNGNTYVVTPEKQDAGFTNKFMAEYQADLASKKARADGYTVSRTGNENGETVLVLRQY